MAGNSRLRQGTELPAGLAARLGFIAGMYFLPLLLLLLTWVFLHSRKKRKQRAHKGRISWRRLQRCRHKAGVNAQKRPTAKILRRSGRWSIDSPKPQNFHISRIPLHLRQTDS